MGRKSASKSMHLYGALYDVAIETLIRTARRHMLALVQSYGISQVLDLCCGTGSFCRRLHDAGRTVCGLDFERGLMRYAVRRHSGPHYLCADAVHPPVADNTFSAAIFSYALHDKNPDQRSAMLSAARRIVKPDGHLLLLDFERPWSARSRLGRVLTALIEKMAGREHERNGLEFLKSGGLCAFIVREGLVERERILVEYGHSAVVLARWP